MDKKRVIGLLGVVIVVGAVIYILEAIKPDTGGSTNVVELASSEEKSKDYPSAKEIVSPSGFVNVDKIQLADLIGKRVILVDFWTYSCINCQRTQPYLNAWQEKYGDMGLTIVGVHTPEFEFEKDISNVQQAVAKAGIMYPVVLDNDYATWRAYGNRYWPRKYLIDIDGYIVYDHIGEGGYEETEKIIQTLLVERAKRLGEASTVDTSVVSVQADAPSAGVRSPEIYFGSSRNEHLANGKVGETGVQQFTPIIDIALNDLVLGSTWNIQPEFAANVSDQATITFRYKAKNVYVVASADAPITVSVKRDGEPVGSFAGDDVDGNSQVIINEEQLYSLIEEDEVSEHTLEITIDGAGLQVFTFTFG